MRESAGHVDKFLLFSVYIQNLPSIGGDGASDDDDDSETEVVFSHINWAAQESMIGDEVS